MKKLATSLKKEPIHPKNVCNHVCPFNQSKKLCTPWKIFSISIALKIDDIMSNIGLRIVPKPESKSVTHQMLPAISSHCSVTFSIIPSSKPKVFLSLFAWLISSNPVKCELALSALSLKSSKASLSLSIAEAVLNIES